jgi:DNA-binding response OmpR family regulator
MARRKKQETPPAETVPPAALSRQSRARILIVAGNRLQRMRLAARLCETQELAECIHTDSARAARTLVASSRFDLALIALELEDGDGLDLVREFDRTAGRPTPILIAEELTTDLAVAAMRSGAIDIVSSTSPAAEMYVAVRSALNRTRADRQREARIERLTRVCHKLNDARHQVTEQVSSLCNDMVTAYQELASQATQMGLVSEFNSLIRQELDVESVLRTALEYILGQTGPTNAAVFLPGSGGCSASSDFTLGAYVNYDVPKDTLDMLLDHVTGFVPRRMEAEHSTISAVGARELEKLFGEHAHWLGDSHALCFACHHEGECLAVGILFRDHRNPFPESVIANLRVIAQLFGRQLSRVIHVHHRHIPKSQWGGFGAPEDDDTDLAA